MLTNARKVSGHFLHPRWSGRSTFVRSQGQRPIIRTDGSLTKAPTVVNRPVESISARSMIRTGEVVVVAMGCSRTRCGMSEPVTKTVTSFGCSRRTETSLTGTGLPASTVPPNIVTATRIIKLGDNIVFTTNTTSTMTLCKFLNRRFSILAAAPDRGAKAPPTFHTSARTSRMAIEVNRRYPAAMAIESLP